MTLLTRLHPYLQWLADQTKPTPAVLRAVQHERPGAIYTLEEYAAAVRQVLDLEAQVVKARAEGHAAGLAEGERLEREAVVRYMRARANDGPCVEDVADEIERGKLPDPDCGWCHGGGTVSSSIDIRQPECPCRYERGDHRQEAE